MSSDQRKDRLNRIQRRALPAVVAAFEAGKISAKRADLLLHMPKAEQKAELDRRLSEAHERERRNLLVATTLRQYLDALNDEKVDLIRVSKLIKEALA